MFRYLLDNHIYFFIFLVPTEVNGLLSINKYFKSYFTSQVWENWYLLLINQGYFPKMNIYSSSISLVTNENHVISIDKKRKTRDKAFYQYLALMKIYDN